MKMLILFIFSATLFAGNKADVGNLTGEIRTVIKTLINTSPNPNKVFELWHPLNLKNEKHFNVSTAEYAQKKYNVSFQNVTVSKLNDSESRQNDYSEFDCTFHQYLRIDLALKPENLEIIGFYETKSLVEKGDLENFTVKLYGGRILHTMYNNDVNETKITHRNESIKVGKLTQEALLSVHAMGELIAEIKNKTLNKFDKSRFDRKIADFIDIFPFLRTCLLPKNEAALRLPKNNYTILNNETMHWKFLLLSIPKVIIYGIDDFKTAKITAYSVDEIGARYKLTIDTNPLNGNFVWYYWKNDSISSKNKYAYNFTIDNLTISAQVIYDYKWIVNYVESSIGEIRIHRNNAVNSDINQFMYYILHEHLKGVITLHLQKLIRDEYPHKMHAKMLSDLQTNELKILIDSFSQVKNEEAKRSHLRTNTSSNSFQEAWNKRHTPNEQYYKGLMALINKTISKIHQNGCVDDRRLWQRIFFRNKCTSTNQTNITCVDNRRLLTKLFVKNPCLSLSSIARLFQ